MSSTTSGHLSAARLFYGLGVAGMLLVLAYYGASVLVPLVVAMFLTFLIVTLKDLMLSIPLVGRHLPAWVGFIVAFIVIFAALLLFIQIVRMNVDSLVRDAPLYQTRLLDLIDQLRAAAPGIGDIDTIWSDLRQNIRVAPLISDIAAPLRVLAANLVTVFLYTGFLLVERGAIVKKIAAITETPEKQAAVNALLDDIAYRVRQYLSVKTFTSALVAGLSYIILLILGIDYASFWATLIFTLNYIPIVGSIVAVTFPVILTLLQFGDIGRFLISLLTLTGAQMFVGNIIEPRMLGASLNLSPLVILLSLATWGLIWGIPGMLLCVPIMVTIMIVLAQFTSTRAVAVMLSANGQIGVAFNRQLGQKPAKNKVKLGL